MRHVGARAGRAAPTLYHFHSLKIVSARRAVLYYMYRIGRPNRWIYDRYVLSLRAALAQMRSAGVPVVARPLFPRWRGRLRFVWTLLTGRAGWTYL